MVKELKPNVFELIRPPMMPVTEEFITEHGVRMQRLFCGHVYHTPNVHDFSVSARHCVRCYMKRDSIVVFQRMANQEIFRRIVLAMGQLARQIDWDAMTPDTPDYDPEYRPEVSLETARGFEAMPELEKALGLANGIE